ncbi:hypothetical protein [Blautia pseudococcoides]|uniref:hypothetical protein n=1 Tax=Blautia pseudococcoides TaxID=1796616 RepID=UPI0012F4BEF4|nr:hypothetical protein [Blautia pseudococcoides]QJU16178.1 hypothetical protein HL650_18110 [Blautia pseudococcoides]QQQ91317.1 hypothetical protein I5Q86_13260 [Blautia pseudococcoides]
MWKQIVTKAKKKLIKNVTAKTLMKGLVAYGGMKFIDQLIDSGRKTLQDTMKEWGRGGIQAVLERLFPKSTGTSSSSALIGAVLAALSNNPGINISCAAGGT